VELRQQRAAALALALALLTVLLAAAPARADDLQFPKSQTKPPPGYTHTAKQVIAIADRDHKVVGEKARRGTLRPFAYTKPSLRQWQVSYFRGDKELAQVTIDDATGAVLESWTGPQVAWKMARGIPGAFAGKLCRWYIWIPLCIAFVMPFVSLRRPRRLLHLDLLVLIAFGASHFFFNKGQIDKSVPLAYPVLLYLLGRMLWVGFRRPKPADRGPLTWASATWLAAALVFLVGFRLALNMADSNVIDVGYAGVIGADKITHSRSLYDGTFPKNNEHGDTYGPVNYIVYVPFRSVFGWSGRWDSLPAAHAAAIFFDLMTLLGLLVLGRRLRAGPDGKLLGVSMAYAWAAFPYTLYALDSNSNDTLLAAFLVWALVAVRSAPLRGALIGFGAAAKFLPLALAPLFATSGSRHRWRGAVLFSVVVVLTFALPFLPFLPDGGLRELYDRTLGYQVGRDSPFSIWGQHDLGALWTAVKVVAAGLAVLVAFVPRQKTPVQIGALGAAVLLAFQVAAAHWFYLYIPWFFGFVLVAIFARYSTGEPESAARRDEQLLDRTRPAVVAGLD
jgi:hypothetical protein